ncbi:MAG: AEC family transporter, partial [Betaproteobacteria bacterium]
MTGKFGLFKDTASTELNYFVLWLALPAQLFSYTSKNKAQILEQPLFLVAFLGGSLLIYLLMYLLHWRSSRSNLGANFWGLSSSY